MLRFSKFLAVGMVLMLAGCISGKTHQDTYTDKSGATTAIHSDREQCEDACNDEYSRCMDTMPAHSNPVPGSPAGMFGASADCRADLKNCLPECKKR